jgi:K+-transporting ATPase KdpF subunit
VTAFAREGTVMEIWYLIGGALALALLVYLVVVLLKPELFS